MPNLKTTRINDDDRAVGAKVRELRVTRGLTQQQLAILVGITYQQQHKYERGVNRIAIGSLIKIARALGVHPSYFFENVEQPVNDEQQRLKLELSRVFDALPSKQRTAFIAMARAMLPQNDPEHVAA